MLEIIVFISSKISLLTRIDPMTACYASMLFGNSLNWSLTILRLFSMRINLHENRLNQIINWCWGKECIIIELYQPKKH